MNQTLAIRIPDNLKRDLEKLSKKEDRPVSDLVRDSLKRYVAIRRFSQLRDMVLPFAEAQGIFPPPPQPMRAAGRHQLERGEVSVMKTLMTRSKLGQRLTEAVRETPDGFSVLQCGMERNSIS